MAFHTFVLTADPGDLGGEDPPHAGIILGKPK